ncbi:glycosyltransferase family 4 protein (plasmid) [Thioclava sp. 'Guangxiensis']|uniref:glycosyltransferase family 4 protein n=1 Tax=Thioclava sp. 'Guangxiensis' TaxID=3149044 RepID=UPI0032C4A6D5
MHHAPPPAPIAYLSGEYPKVSHTFIQREIEALRQQGWQVETCSVRRTSARDVVGEDQIREQAATFAIFDAIRSPAKVLGAQIWALRRDARAWGRTLKLAWSTRPDGLKAALWQIFYFLEAAILARHLSARGVVHLHNHFANSSCSVAMLASGLSGIPFSLTMHGPAIFYEPRRWRIDEKIARASFVSCISHFCRAQAMYFSAPQHWSKLKIVHCGIFPALYAPPPTRDDTAAQTDRQEILFVGRLAAIKGVPLLVEAFARLADSHPQARLSVIGDGPERAYCEALARDLGVGARVIFHGYQSAKAVARHMRQADLLVLASFAEGVPVTLMEAMGSGLPVIASRVAGVGELVEDGVSGFTIPAGDLDSLTDRLDRLLGDPALRAAMGVQGRAKVCAEFDLEHEAQWLGALLLGAQTGRLPAGLRPEPAPAPAPVPAALSPGQPDGLSPDLPSGRSETALALSET